MGAACCAGSAIAGSAAPTSLFDGTIYSFLTAIPIGVYLYYPQLTLLLVTLAVLGASTFYVVLVMLTPEQRSSSPSELTYLSVGSKASQPLANLDSEAEVQLSVVVPAYNEKERLPIMLKETVEFLEELKSQKRSLSQGLKDDTIGSTSHANGSAKVKATSSVHQALQQPFSSYEIIIVDDGSKDATHQVALDFATASPYNPDMRVVRLVKNRGKGGAVRHGVLHSRGSLILFADADGATRFADLSTLCQTLSSVVTDKGHGVAVGSRAHMVKSDAVVKRSFVRNLLMHGFHLFLTLLLRPPTLSSVLRRLRGANKSQCNRAGKGKAKQVVSLPVQPEIKDTQCGFKLFTRPTAQLVFPSAHIDGWIFDVELLILTQMSSQAAQTKLAKTPPPSPAPEFNTSNSNTNEKLSGLPIPIAEVAVHWQEVGGSKIDLIKDSMRMALDLIVIRANYGLARWNSPPPAI